LRSCCHSYYFVKFPAKRFVGERVKMARGELLTPTGSERPAIALDNGSSSIKIGFCGEEAPRALVPTSGLDEAAGVVPISGGVVQDWEAMETYWDHAFTHHLKVDTEQCNVILTANLWETKLNKERLAQALFESFAVPAIYVSSPAVFELYAAGRESGVIVGCGGDCTYAVLMHEGLADPRTLIRGSVAGAQLTAHAASLLAAAAGAALSPAVAEAAKRAVGCVASCSGGAAEAPAKFTLPDGKVIEVRAAQQICNLLHLAYSFRQLADGFPKNVSAYSFL